MEAAIQIVWGLIVGLYVCRQTNTTYKQDYHGEKDRESATTSETAVLNLWRQITLFVASNHVVGLCEAQAQAQRSNQLTTTASCCSVVLLAPVGTAFSLFNFGLDVA